MSKEGKPIRDAKKTELTFYDDGRGYYVPSDFATQQNIKRMKEEYTRLRDIARKRIKYLREKGLYSEEFADKQFAKIPKIAEMNAESNGSLEVFRVELAKALSDASKLLNQGPSTVRRATDYREKVKSDFERDWAYLKQWADRTLPGALDNIDPSTINIEGFYDLMDYYKSTGDNFNYWTGRELRNLFGLNYEDDIVKKTPRVYLDNLFIGDKADEDEDDKNKIEPVKILSGKEMKKEAKKKIRSATKQVKRAMKTANSYYYDKDKHRYVKKKPKKKG